MDSRPIDTVDLFLEERRLSTQLGPPTVGHDNLSHLCQRQHC